MDDKVEKLSSESDVSPENLDLTFKSVLAKRADTWSKGARKIADRWSLEMRPKPFTPSAWVNSSIHLLGMDFIWIPAKAGELTLGFMRNRLTQSQQRVKVIELKQADREPILIPEKEAA